MKKLLKLKYSDELTGFVMIQYIKAATGSLGLALAVLILKYREFWPLILIIIGVLWFTAVHTHFMAQHGKIRKIDAQCIEEAKGKKAPYAAVIKNEEMLYRVIINKADSGKFLKGCQIAIYVFDTPSFRYYAGKGEIRFPLLISRA